jgi:hypothetical protein
MTLTHPNIDWANRWIGGFCAVAAVGGLPVRGADYAAHPPLAATLPLPPVTLGSDTTHEAARTAWSQALGGASVVLVRSAARARMLILAAAGVKPGEPVGVPANGDRDLVESIKHFGAWPTFFELDSSLTLILSTAWQRDVRYCWTQPVGGVGGACAATWVDCSDTLPNLERPAILPPVTLFGLQLSSDERHAGALLVFGDTTLAQAVEARLTPDDAPEPSRALAQLQRLCDAGATPGLACRQRAALAETQRGLCAAAGLVLLADSAVGALAHHIAVRIPEESDPATFYAYVQAEQTPVRWLPLVRPLHYAAVREADRSAETAAELSRWLLVPVGPEYTDEEIKHAVLGVVKAAEYLGVRFRTDPARSASYAAMLDELYGPGHDAYQPVFPLASR